METNEFSYRNGLNLLAFDLGEAGGGKQLIIDHKPISDKEYYVSTLSNVPKTAQEQQSPVANENSNSAANVGKQLLDSIRNHIPGLNKSQQNAALNTKPNTKIRYFKLSQVEGKKYLIEEFVTPQSISEVVSIMGVNKDETVATK